MRKNKKNLTININKKAVSTTQYKFTSCLVISLIQNAVKKIKRIEKSYEPSGEFFNAQLDL